jgi:uncharacterized membrane protein YccC
MSIIVFGSVRDLLRSSVLVATASRAVAGAAVLLAFATSAPIVLELGLPSRLIVFAVVVSLQVANRPPVGPSPRWRVTLVALPLLAVVTSLLGAVMEHDRAAGDVLVIAALSGSFATRSAPVAVARAGRLLSLPVVMLFVTPVPGGGGRDLGWYVFFSLLAGLCVFIADRLLARFAAGWALHAALAEFPRLARVDASRLRRFATELDTRIAAQARGSAAPLRRALLEAELATTAAPRQLEATLARLAHAAVTTRFGSSGREAEERPARRSRLRPQPTTRIALHSGLALALALVIAQHLYPGHWSWAAVSVLAISGGLRSRGDVLVRGGERLLGALCGTVTATLLGNAVSSNHTLSVALILALVVAGSLLRQSTYALYAFCVTSALALLYGVYGEQGTHLLAERLVENVLGAACVILPSYFLLPIRTEAVIRGRVADMLSALSELLASLADGAAADRVVGQARTVDRRRGTLEDAVRPVTIHGHLLRFLGREPLRAAHLATTATASADAARPHIYVTLARRQGEAAPTLRALRQQVGSLRRALASTPERTTSTPETAGHEAS